MDKAEYKIKLEEINALAERGDFQGAAKVASDIDWRHVRSVRTLCMIGEIYEACKRYDDSMAVLKLAYRRSSSSKTVLYRLADLSIREGDFDEAKRYANEFEQVAPNDSSRYILKYKMLRAQKAPLDDQIAVLQEYKDKEYTERWAYELAKLYRKNGQNEKCIEECDDMILWFSEGKYVKKAMELKMQLTSLTKAQKAKYDRMNNTVVPDSKKNKYVEAGLDGISTVEKAVSEASESEEAVESLDHTTTDLRTQAEKAQDAKASAKADGEDAKEKAPNKITDDIKSYISNIRSKDEKNKDQKSDEVTETAGEKKQVQEKSDAEGNKEPIIKSLEPESIVASNASVVQDTKPMPDLNLDESANGRKADGKDLNELLKEPKINKDEPLDLDKLFAETSSSLSSEIASGRFKLDDQMESDKTAAENGTQKKPAASDKDAEKPNQTAKVKTAAASGPLTDKETDESLGLTREFNLKDEVNQELKRRKRSAAENETPIPKPEDAARETVLEAQGKLGTIVEPSPKQEDTATFQKFGNDQAIQKELLADEGDLKDIPKEDSHEALMNLSTVSARNVEGSRDIIDHIMQEPAVFHKVPVEARRLDEREKQDLSYLAEIPGIDFQVTSALADIHNNCGDKTSRSGNVIIMGRQGAGKTRLAKGLIAMVCQHLHLQAAKVAIIIADELNTKDPVKVVQKMAGGFLVIEAAGSLSDETIDKLNQAMSFRTDDLLVILEDEKHDMRSMLQAHPEFAERFTSRITVPVFTNDELVTFAKTYAKENRYKLDELATLALYTMIGDNQKDSEPVTVGAVKDMVDKAIDRHKRKHRFSKSEKTADGRVILKEKDFNF